MHDPYRVRCPACAAESWEPCSSRYRTLETAHWRRWLAMWRVHRRSRAGFAA